MSLIELPEAAGGLWCDGHGRMYAAIECCTGRKSWRKEKRRRKANVRTCVRLRIIALKTFENRVAYRHVCMYTRRDLIINTYVCYIIICFIRSENCCAERERANVSATPAMVYKRIGLLQSGIRTTVVGRLALNRSD